jgi:hypothetical protein
VEEGASITEEYLAAVGHHHVGAAWRVGCIVEELNHVLY